MSQAVTFLKKTIQCQVTSGAILGGVAWGTRFISKISTQDPMSAAIVGALGALPIIIGTRCCRELEDPMEVGVCAVITLSLAILVPTVLTPNIVPLVNRNISYSAAALFGVLNTFCILILDNYRWK